MTPETMSFYSIYDIIAVFCDINSPESDKVIDYIDTKVSWGSDGSVTFVTGKLVIEALKATFENPALDILPQDFGGTLVALNY